MQAELGAPGVEEPVHPHLLDHVVALVRLQPVGGGRSPGAADQRVGLLDAGKQGGIELQPRGPRLDDVPDVDHRSPRRAEDLGQRLDVAHHVLGRGVGWGARVGEGAALDDQVVLHVLDD